MGRPKSELGDIRTSARSVRTLRWLRRKPLPAKVVGETAEGEECTCVVSGGSTQELHDVISVVGKCDLLKALDEKGNSLRTLTLDPTDPELRAESEAAGLVRAAASAGNGSVPIISVDLPKLVDNIARNIREAAAEAARQNAHAHREGYGAMVSVVNVALNLLAGVETRLNALQEHQQRQQMQGPDPNDPTTQRNSMAMMALQKVMGGNGNGSSNGGNGSGGFDPMKLMQFMQTLKDAPSGDENAS